MVWDKNKPAGSQKLRLADDDIRNNNAAIEAALDEDHTFLTGGSQTGEHHKITLPEQASDPTNAANKGLVYSKDVSGETELFYRDATGNVLQLTRGGDHALIPSGTKMLFYQDTAPVGWTLQTALDEKLAFITKGSDFGVDADGGTPGGASLCGSIPFDTGTNANNLQSGDQLHCEAGGWTCNVKSVEYSGTQGSQAGRIYIDTLAGGTPADDDSFHDHNSRSFSASVNGSYRPAGNWIFSGASFANSAVGTHTHAGPNHRHGGGDYVGSGGFTLGPNWTTYYEGVTGGGGNHNHTFNYAYEWRPQAYACIICAKD